jgi:hypothetical protein
MMKSNERTALARTPVIKKTYSYSPCNQHIKQIMGDVRNECDYLPSTTWATASRDFIDWMNSFLDVLESNLRSAAFSLDSAPK